ncbi:MAG: autotransporter outer membrane beta-barrel domain-containing protein [Pseudolabrys sp.]|nr:autotransporter outer membrane beta-barrel domain-containing protein [Pseudolabrys sp.]MDP2298834.1 autotransporter outer membrane beta-barrel domain-containing protein [Pseudolabrys sp.]
MIGHLVYDPTNVYFLIDSIGIANLLVPGTINQRNVAGGIDNALINGAAVGVFAPVLSLPGAALGTALDQLSGEVGTGAQRSASNMAGQFLGLMVDPFIDGRDSDSGTIGAIGFAPERSASLPAEVAFAYAGVLKPAPKQPSFSQRWSVWAAPFGGYNETAGDTSVGSSDLTARTFGVAAGVDYRLTPDTTIGVALAGGGSNWSMALGSGRSDAFQAGVYGISRFGAAYISGSAAFGNHWMSTDRTAFGGSRLTADFNAQVYGGRIEAGYRIPMIVGTLTPYAALRAMAINIGSYAETGGGFALNVASRRATETRGELGARFGKLVRFNNMPLKLRAQAAWAHDWISDPSMSATFQALPGSGFVVHGASAPKNLVLASVGAELQLTPAWQLSTKLESEFGKGSQTYGGTAALRYRW